jgi:hypothetical protein
MRITIDGLAAFEVKELMDQTQLSGVSPETGSIERKNGRQLDGVVLPKKDEILKNSHQNSGKCGYVVIFIASIEFLFSLLCSVCAKFADRLIRLPPNPVLIA